MRTPEAKPAAGVQAKALTRRGFDFNARWIALLAPLLAFAASATSFWNDFATDDLQQVLGNNFIKKLSNLPHAFTTSVWAFANGDVVFSVDSYYRPLFSALFCFNYALFGSIPLGWHIVNAVIHAAVTGLVFVLIAELTGNRRLSVLTAALFAVHPSHAESVAWISGVTDPLMGLFLLPSFLFYVRWRKHGRAVNLSLALALYFLALLTKETSLALMIVVAGYELLYQRKSGFWNDIAKSFGRAAIFIAPTVVYFLMRYNALNSFLFANGSRFPTRWGLLTAPLALLKYIWLMLVPVGYSYQHLTHFVTHPTQLEFLGPLVLVIALAVGVLLAPWNEFRFGMLWFIAFLLPLLAAISQFDQEYVVQERYLYLPSMGFCMAISLLVERLSKRSISRVQGPVPATALSAVLIILWGSFYVVSSHIWRDSLSVYRNCVTKAPDSAEAHCTLSRAYYETGRAREADVEARKALELDTQLGMTYLNLSYYAHRAGRIDEAIDFLERGSSTVQLTPLTRHSVGTIYLNLALLLAQKQQYDRAEDAYQKSIDASPRAVAWFYAGQFYFDQNQYDRALDMFEKARDRVPRWFALIHLKLAQVYDRLGKDDLARSSYEKFLEIAPAGDENRSDAERKLKRL